MTDDMLQHYGIKGMRWGIRRFQPYQKGDGPKGKFTDDSKKASSQNGNKSNRVTVKDKVASSKRELSWNQKLKEFDSMTDSQKRETVNRSRLESDFKRLSNKNKVGTSQDKKDYVQKRADMTTQELQNRVGELQMKDNLRNNMRNSNQGLIDAGKAAAAIAAPIAIQIALHDGVDKGWLVDKMKSATFDPKNWDQLGKQAAKAVDSLL